MTRQDDITKREQTDESLRVERAKTDALDAKKRDAVENEADDVVVLARRRADEVVQAARDGTDREATGSSATATEPERTRADQLLEHERAIADALLDAERVERRRYLADFLISEREATDKDLVVERAHADTLIAARDEFLSTVSHDLRSLLNALALNAALLADQAPDGPSGDKLRRHIATSARLVGRMNRLISDLLDVASIEVGTLAFHPEKVEVAELLRDTVEAFELIAAAKHITIESDATSVPLHASVDGGRMLQVLANLVSNAIKFTPAGGRISIRLRAEQDEIWFAVSDTGIGIPAAALEGVFERFRQVSKDRRGLGLGLHISKSIVEAHGGRLWVESTLGAGSTFYFSLPATPQ